MPDKKLTDNEIIKALDKLYNTSICATEFQVINVEGLRKFGVIIKCTLDLITRQQAEIENYKHLDVILHTAIDKLSADIKSEAVKEFAENIVEKVEKARQKYQRLCKEQGEEEDEAMNIHFRGMINLVKEMVGD